jgi:hypothetical protein
MVRYMRFAVIAFAALPFAPLACTGDDPIAVAAAQGKENGPCFSNGTCDQGLVCVVPNTCVRPDAADPGADASVAPDSDAAAADDAPASDAPPDGPLWSCPTSKLIAWWKFENDTADEEGRIPLGSSSATPAYVTKVTGDSAFVLDGASWLVGTGPFATLPGLPAITIEAWVHFPTVASLQSGTIFTTGNDGFTFGVNGGHLQCTAMVSGAPVMVTDTADGGLTPGDWAHVAVTGHPGAAIQMYVNGASVPVSGTCPSLAPAVALQIGGMSGFPSLTGSISDLAIYAAELSPSDVDGVRAGTVARCR